MLFIDCFKELGFATIGLGAPQPEVTLLVGTRLVINHHDVPCVWDVVATVRFVSGFHSLVQVHVLLESPEIKHEFGMLLY